MDYEIPKTWEEVFEQVNQIGKNLRSDAFAKSFSIRSEYEKSLAVATGCYQFLVVEYKKYRALKENKEVEKYVALKESSDGKFISAAADREASLFVAKDRYYRDLLEGHVLGSEALINTLKKFIDSDKKEEKYS